MSVAAAAFLRFSRDRRGYEHFYLVHATTNRRGKTRSRILYWFRTPPGVKVGRLPFDDDVRRAIEARNPGVDFDWKKLLSTPIPPPAPDVERWRERRRIERAERAARVLEETAEPDASECQPEPVVLAPAAREELMVELEPISAGEPEECDEPIVPVRADSAQAAGPPQIAARKRRRRRRGGRRNPGPANGSSAPSNGSE